MFLKLETISNSRRAICAGVALFALFALLVVIGSSVSAAPTGDNVVISEWTSRGPGGSTDEFVELYNPTESTIDVSAWQIWTYNASSLFCPDWCERINLPGAPSSMTTVIPAKSFFLIADSCGSYSGQTPDAWFVCTVGFKDDNGTIRLTTGTSGTNATVDTVAWEAYPDYAGARLWAEGGTPTSGRGYSDDAKSVERKAEAGSTDASMAVGGIEEFAGNGRDTDNSASDWFVRIKSNPQRLSDSPERMVFNLDMNKYFGPFQSALNAATDGDAIQIRVKTLNEDLIIDAKNIIIEDSDFNLQGDTSLRNGATLTIDPSTVNITGNVWVDNGTTLNYLDSTFQFDCGVNSEFGILVNDTGIFNVKSSTIRSKTGPVYDLTTYGRISVIDSQVEDFSTIRFESANSNSLFKNSVIRDSQGDLVTLYGTSLFIENCTLSNPGNWDAWLGMNSHITFLNSSFSNGNIWFEDFASTTETQWYLDVYLHFGGTPLVDGDVYVYDQSPSYTMLGKTGGDGWLKWSIVTENVQDKTGTVLRTPHNVYGDIGTFYGSEVVKIDQSMAVSINVLLNHVEVVETGQGYVGIQQAVDAAVAGYHILIYDGLYNETVYVNKAIHIAGNTPYGAIVSGNGVEDTFRVAAEGFEILDLNITNTGADKGIYFTVGGFNVHDNQFWGSNYGIYVDIYHYQTGSTTIGDMVIQNNVLGGGSSIYFTNIEFEEPQDGSAIVVGQTLITGNDVTTNIVAGIYLNDYYAYDTTGGSITWGDINITGNTINSGDQSIYVYGHFEGLRDVTVQVGKYDISSNVITSPGDYGIELDWWDIEGLYGSTSVTVGQTLINDNWIDSFDTGILVNWDSVGNDIHDTVSITVGDIIIDPNNITSGADGISFLSMDSARNMFNDSSLTMGNVLVDSNIIDSTGKGIYVNFENTGYYMYGDSLATFGWVDIINNDITSDAKGIHAQQKYFGSRMYNTSQVTAGDWNVNGNTIWSEGYGLHIEQNFRLRDLHHFSQVSFGNLYVYKNDIFSNGSIGLVSYLSWTGCDMEDYSKAEVGDVEIAWNNVEAADTGIHFGSAENWGREMHDYSELLVGDWSITDNNITNAGNYGIRVSVGPVANRVYDTSKLSKGDVSVLRNNITSSDHGVNWNIDDHAYDVKGDNVISIGSYLVNENIITSTTGHGIYTWGVNNIARTLQDAPSITFGDFEFNGNTIDAGSYGIYHSQWWQIGERIEGGGASITLGHFQTNDNIIDSTSKGIYLSNFNQWGSNFQAPTTATFQMGNFEIQRNNVTSGGTGIDTDVHSLGEDLEDGASVTFGDFLFNENWIDAGDIGMFFDDWGEHGYQMHGDASASFGNFEVIDNNLTSTNDGMTFSILDNWGRELNGDNDVSYGYFLLEENIITAGASGLSIVGMFHFATDMFGDSTFQMGNIDIIQNDIQANAGHGMWLNCYEFGVALSGTAQADFGTFRVWKNTVNATNDGMLINSLSKWGFILEGFSQVTFGDVLITENNIQAGWGGAQVDGLYFNMKETGKTLSGFSSVTLGHVKLNANTIDSRTGHGIHIDWLHSIGYIMSGSSSFTMGQFEVQNSIIEAKVNGTLFGDISDIGTEITDQATTAFGDFLVCGNEIMAQDSGISVLNFQRLGSALSINGKAAFGDIRFNDNDIESFNNTMIFYDLMYWGYNLTGSSHVSFQNFQINGNRLNSTNDTGIYLTCTQYIGADLNDVSTFEMKNFEISGNIINASDDGVEIEEMERWGYMMANVAQADFGGFFFNDNNIICLDDGLDIRDIDYMGYYLYDYSSVAFGGVEVLRNEIIADGDGIELHMDNLGNHMYGNSRFAFGNFYINYNVVNSTDEALCWYPYDFGENMNDYAFARIGDFEMIGNKLNSSNDIGAHITWFDGFGSYMEENSRFVSGNATVTGNEIISDYWGMEVEIDYPLEHLYDSASATNGWFKIYDNTISGDDIALRIYLRAFGDIIEDNAFGEIGVFEVTENDLTSDNGTGLELKLSDYLSDIIDNAVMTIGDITISGNTISAKYDGILTILQDCIEVDNTATVRFPGINVIDNIVDPNLRAFSYYGMGTPISIGGSVDLSIGDLHLEGNQLDGGLYGAVFAWNMSPALGGQPNIRLVDNDIFDGPANSTGLYFHNISAAFIDDVSINNYTSGIFANNSNVMEVINSTISNCTTDVILNNTAYVFFIETDFDNTSVTFQDDASIMDVGWFMHVHVKTAAGNFVPDAQVLVSDVSNWVKYDGMANGAGKVEWLRCQEYRENITGRIMEFSPYTATAEKVGNSGTADTVMNQTRTVVVVLPDIIPPQILSDMSDSAGTTGEDFSFSVGASDDMGIAQVLVYYLNVDDPTAVWESSQLTAGSPYGKTLALDSAYAGNVEYYFEVTDVGGNTVASSHKTFPVTDNDIPEFNTDNSDITAAIGENFIFSADAADNVNITLAEIIYHFGSGANTTEILPGFGTYELTIVLPNDPSNDLYYVFRFQDAAGNAIQTPEKMVVVSDSNAPVLGADSTPSSIGTGSVLTITIEVTDVHLVSQALVEYWFSGQTHITALMSGTGPYTYAVSIPSDSILALSYRVNATDPSGNTVLSATKTVTVVDDDAPTGLVDNSHDSASTGEVFTFIASASDNRGITSAQVVWWTDPAGGQETVALSGSGPYVLSINIPENATTLHYHFLMADAALNELTGSDVVMSVIDNDRPVMILDNSDTNAATGNGFDFNVSASDNIGIITAQLTYSYGTDGSTTVSLAGSGPYTYSVTIPNDSTASLRYYFTFTDATGNSLASGTTTVEVTDNVLPELTGDTSDTTATTGNEFAFDVTATDNVQVSLVRAFYWFGADEKTSVALGAGTSSYSASVILPQDSADTLHYYIVVMDISENVYTGVQVDINISDDDKPRISSDDSDNNAVPGEDFDFVVSVEDNIEIENVTVTYWYDDGIRMDLTLNGTGPFTGVATIPAGTGVLHYQFTIEDTTGNILTGSQQDVEVGGAFESETSEYGIATDAVTDASGSPMENAVVTITAEDGSEWTAITDADGRFTALVPEGDYTWTAEKDGETVTGDGDTRALEASVPEPFPWWIIVLVLVAVLVLLLVKMFVLDNRQGGAAADVATEEDFPTDTGAEDIVGMPETVDGTEGDDSDTEKSGDSVDGSDPLDSEGRDDAPAGDGNKPENEATDGPEDGAGDDDSGSELEDDTGVDGDGSEPETSPEEGTDKQKEEPEDEKKE